MHLYLDLGIDTHALDWYSPSQCILFTEEYTGLLYKPLDTNSPKDYTHHMIETAETEQVTRLLQWSFLAGKAYGQLVGNPSGEGRMTFEEWFAADTQEDIRRDVQRVAGQMVSEMM